MVVDVAKVHDLCADSERYSIGSDLVLSRDSTPPPLAKAVSAALEAEGEEVGSIGEISRYSSHKGQHERQGFDPAPQSWVVSVRLEAHRR